MPGALAAAPQRSVGCQQEGELDALEAGCIAQDKQPSHRGAELVPPAAQEALLHFKSAAQVQGLGFRVANAPLQSTTAVRSQLHACISP